jgi:lipoate-protein ligase A
MKGPPRRRPTLPLTERSSAPRSHASPWRLLLDPPADGAWNMAVDEALLESRVAGTGAQPTTFRLYGWNPPALSLGRGQAQAGAHDPDYLRQQGIDLVRRPTGGLAVLHEFEVTYCICGPLRRDPFPGGVLDTYRQLAAAWLAALKRLGLMATSVPERSGALAGQSHQPGVSCFAIPSAHEITVEGRKLVGSAQLRRRNAFLQHGSILLRSDPARLASATGGKEESERFTDLESALGRRVERQELESALVAALEHEFGTSLQPGTLTADEIDIATRLYSWKYCSAAWTYEARVGERERKWGPGLQGDLRSR